MQIAPIFRGCIISLIIVFSLTLILASVSYFGHIEHRTVTRLLLLANYISIGIGGLMAAINVDTKGWLHGGFVGLVYAFCFLLLIALVPGLSMVLGSTAIIQAVVVSFLIGTVGGIVGVNI